MSRPADGGFSTPQDTSTENPLLASAITAADAFSTNVDDAINRIISTINQAQTDAITALEDKQKELIEDMEIIEMEDPPLGDLEDNVGDMVIDDSPVLPYYDPDSYINSLINQRLFELFNIDTEGGNLNLSTRRMEEEDAYTVEEHLTDVLTPIVEGIALAKSSEAVGPLKGEVERLSAVSSQMIHEISTLKSAIAPLQGIIGTLERIFSSLNDPNPNNKNKGGGGGNIQIDKG
jgi:hypothetical protein